MEAKDKEELEKLQTKILELVKDSEIDPILKMNLLTNIYFFLDSNLYEENIRTLQLHYGSRIKKGTIEHENTSTINLTK